MFRAVGSFSRLSGNETAVQGSGGFSLYTPAYGVLLGELEAFGGGSRTGDLTTTQVLALVRGHVSGAAAGAWVGAGAGTASSSGMRRPSRVLEAGGWARRGPARASLTVAPTTVDDTISYTDLNLVAVATAGRLELTAIAGSRSGSQPEIFGTPVKSWASASIVTWLTSRLALVAGAGRYPVDLTQGFPGGTYASVGVRMAARVGGDPETPRSQPAPPPPALAPGAVGELAVSPAGVGRRLLFVRVPEARVVEIAGTFSAWEPLAMASRAEGWWSIDLPLEPGRYEVAIRVDGERWVAPPNLLKVSDEFGGEAGIINVP